MDVIDTKSLYEDILQMHLDEWKEEIDMLQLKSKYASESCRKIFFQQIDILNSKRDKAQSKLNFFKRARKSTWNRIKTDLELCMDDLGNRVQRAALNFSS